LITGAKNILYEASDFIIVVFIGNSNSNPQGKTGIYEEYCSLI